MPLASIVDCWSSKITIDPTVFQDIFLRSSEFWEPNKLLLKKIVVALIFLLLVITFDWYSTTEYESFFYLYSGFDLQNI